MEAADIGVAAALAERPASRRWPIAAAGQPITAAQRQRCGATGKLAAVGSTGGNAGSRARSGVALDATSDVLDRGSADWHGMCNTVPSTAFLTGKPAGRESRDCRRGSDG
jgi:hypothetical protein